MKNLQRFTICLVWLSLNIILVSCQSGNTTDSIQPKETPQVTAGPTVPALVQLPDPKPINIGLAHGTVIVLPDSERWVRMLQLDEEQTYGVQSLSPNGEWIVSNITPEPKQFEFFDIIPTWDEGLMFTFRPEADWGIIEPAVPTWSPDSSRFAYWGVDVPKPYCYHSRLVILQLDSTNFTVAPASFELPWEESDCAAFAWSPDSSMLVVGSTFQQDGMVFVIDTQGQVLQSISLPLDKFEHFSPWIEWTPSGLYYLIFHDIDNGYWVLHKLDLNSQKGDEVFRLGNWRLFGADPTGSSKLLVTQRLFQANDPTLPYYWVDEYAVLDIETQEFLKLEWESPDCYVVPSTTIFTAFACNNPRELWIYNWKEESLNFYGEYDRMLGWSDRYQGYLLKEVNGNASKVVVLQP